MPAPIIKVVKRILKHEGVVNADLSIVFVTDRKIKTLNKQFLRRAYATDVLAFDLSEENLSRLRKTKRGGGKIKKIKGDIVISVTAALKNSKIYRTLIHDEILLYIIHGILHLLGYDDHSPQDIKRIRKKERSIMNYLKEAVTGLGTKV